MAPSLRAGRIRFRNTTGLCRLPGSSSRLGHGGKIGFRLLIPGCWGVWAIKNTKWNKHFSTFVVYGYYDLSPDIYLATIVIFQQSSSTFHVFSSQNEPIVFLFLVEFVTSYYVNRGGWFVVRHANRSLLTRRTLTQHTFTIGNRYIPTNVT